MQDTKTRPVETATKIDPDDAAYDIGRRLTNLREERRWTLQQAGRATGAAASTLSKIERGELSPTISTLRKIAKGFGIDLIELLSPKPELQPLAGRRSITRVGSGNSHTTNTCLNELLCDSLEQKRMTPIFTKIRARSVDEYSTWPKSDTEIFLYVIKGKLIVHSKIYKPIELCEGDSMYYDASTEHVWTSAGPLDAEILWVICG